MPIDPASFDSGTPRTFDGRTYPEHLKPYEAYDETLLPLIAHGQVFERDDLVVATPSTLHAIDIARWLSSAEWRGLIARHDESMSGPRLLAITERGLALLRA